MNSGSGHNPYQPPKAEVRSEEEVGRLPRAPLASRSRRFWGSMIDGLLLFAVNLPIIIYLTPDAWERAKTNSLTFSDDLIGSVLAFVVFVAVNAYTLKTRGQTIGKLALGTRIVSHDTGQLLPLARLVSLRYGPIYLLGVLPPVGQIAGTINVLFIFRQDRRCLHDHIAGTIVTMTEPTIEEPNTQTA